MTKRFTEEQFKPTQRDSAAVKAQFANHFVRFVESDFAEKLFDKKFYNRLSKTFGHIAHYDQHGFCETFFTDLRGKIAFLRQTVEWSMGCDPRFTYSDVEQVLREWVLENGTLDRYQKRLAEETEAGERELLAKLKAKYEPVPANAG